MMEGDNQYTKEVYGYIRDNNYVEAIRGGSTDWHLPLILAFSNTAREQYSNLSLTTSRDLELPSLFLDTATTTSRISSKLGQHTKSSARSAPTLTSTRFTMLRPCSRMACTPKQPVQLRR